MLTHRTNGVSNYLVTYGIFIFLFYFVLILYALTKLSYNYHPKYAIYGLILIFIVGFSEVFFSRHFYGLAMLHMVVRYLKRTVYPVNLNYESTHYHLAVHNSKYITLSCLSLLSNQSIRDFSIVVVDDGSGQRHS